MAVERANAFTMYYESFELEGKRLFGTGYTINHDTVPDGFYCYDVWNDGVEDSEEHIFISRHIARNPYKPHQKKYYHLKSKSNSHIMKGISKTHFHRRNGK